MFKKNKIKKGMVLSTVILIFSFYFFIILRPSFADNENVSEAVTENVSKVINEKVDNNINCDTEYLKLLEAVKIKADVANEKESTYERAINQLKIYVTFFGSLLVLIAIAFGFYKDKKIVDAKDEIFDSIEEKKKSLEAANSLNIEKKMLDLDKNNNIRIEAIRNETFGDINDLFNRVKNLEIGKKNAVDKDTEENNDKEIPFKDPYE